MPRYRVKDPEMHTGQTLGLDSFLSTERHRIMDSATPAKREQMRAAEGARGVYRAWNAVVGGTREGRHATGLRYLPESNELLVYMDSPSWTQEMTLLREIVRARMERAGAHVDGLIFKTTRPGHTPPAAKDPLRPRAAQKPPAPHADLTPAEDAEIEAEVAPVADARLREALARAMKASAEWRKGASHPKEP